MNVPCPVCGTPLDKALPAAGFTTHPGCDPVEISAQWPPETAGDPRTLPGWRALVTGSRDWPDDGSVETVLEIVAAHPNLTVVHGDAPQGADFLAGFWARRQQRAGRSVTEEPHPADWARFGKAAGFRRNAEMVTLGADVCLMFAMPCMFGPPHCNDPHPHDTHGTRHCAGLARAAGIPVRRITPESCRLQATTLQDQETPA